ncbi:MAG: hypothetical protein LBT62_07065, partial [Deltaproteobacteria bacterium]|nr:hypothetical protein [Deltaproteobacteria bacterium]
LEVLEGARIVFIATGLGGGTGTGGAPVVAQALKEKEEPSRPMVVAVPVLPFPHERNRIKVAEAALKEIFSLSNSVIPIDNSKLIEVFPRATVKECRKATDDILVRAVRSITELISNQGQLNLDLCDIESVLSFQGQAIIGYGEACGPGRIDQVIKNTISSPLMSDVSLAGAKAVLINVTASSDILLEDYITINEKIVFAAKAQDVQVFSGLAVDEQLAKRDAIKVTVLATGLSYAKDSADVKSMESGIKAVEPAKSLEPGLKSIEPADEFHEQDFAVSKLQKLK